MHINYGLRPFCDYLSSPTVGLAIAGAIALVLAHIIITITTDGCCSCYLRTPNEPICAQFFLIISWYEIIFHFNSRFQYFLCYTMINLGFLNTTMVEMNYKMLKKL
ncbi:hypothetical protein Hanom_Chr04g00309041 [Helianthus anomalus]